MVNTTSRTWNKPLTIILIISIWMIGMWIKFLFFSVHIDDQGLKYNVREGASTRAVIDDLYARHIIDHPFVLKLLVYAKGVSHQLKAGQYFFPKGSTPLSILRQINTGTGMLYYSFTIVPGWNFHELRAALEHNENLRHLTSSMTDQEIMKALGHPDLKPEGEFFPDTYFFSAGGDDVSILKRSYKAMQEKLNNAWSQRATDVPFKSSYEALIAASIIEKEAYFGNELPKIAGVMVNRLRKNMLLQFDPTVIYGIGDRYDGKIHKADLTNDNPYNTYIHKGLPPTPISMPSLAAINAIMHPMKHDFYYFVAQSNRSSQFNTQLSDHNKAVAVVRGTKPFFNTALTRYYLLKLFSQQIFFN